MAFQFLSSSNLLIFILIFLSLIIFTAIYNTYRKQNKSHFLFRLALLSIFIFLLFNPVISYTSKKNKALSWAFFFDNSASLKYHISPSLVSINSGLDEIVDKIKKEEIENELFTFDSIISEKTSPITGNGQTTNLGKLADFISKREFAGSVIFTDGISTEGIEPILTFNNLDTPIYTVGIGNKNSLIDVFLNSVEAPTVAVKNERVNVSIEIQSIGDIDDQFSVSLYDGSRLIASKYINLYGNGSKALANFQFQTNSIGRQKFSAQVSSLSDEVNIQNNKQNFDILVIKDKYKVALITGSPNKNTSVIKKTLFSNQRIDVDHYIKISPSKFNKDIRSFWGTPYDLIMFDNYPIEPLKANFIRVLAKKIISQQSSLMLIAGANQTNESTADLLPLIGLESGKELEELSDDQFWDFEDETTFSNDIPPLKQKLFLSEFQEGSDAVATFESGWPLLIRTKKNNLRSVAISASNINKLFFNKNSINAFSKLFIESIEWLIQSGVSSENFFRTNRDYYQQGEIVYLSGSNVFNKDDLANFRIDVLKNEKIILSKKIDYNIDLKKWESSFRAPNPGKYNLEIYSNSDTEPIQTNDFKVLESQVELNQVYLNDVVLKQISSSNQGAYLSWENRDQIFDFIEKKEKEEVKANVIKFKDNTVILIMALLLLCSEWAFRKQKGMF